MKTYGNTGHGEPERVPGDGAGTHVEGHGDPRPTVEFATPGRETIVAPLEHDGSVSVDLPVPDVEPVRSTLEIPLEGAENSAEASVISSARRCVVDGVPLDRNGVVRAAWEAASELLEHHHPAGTMVRVTVELI